jgi:hypothetical protein
MKERIECNGHAGYKISRACCADVDGVCIVLLCLVLLGSVACSAVQCRTVQCSASITSTDRIESPFIRAH